MANNKFHIEIPYKIIIIDFFVFSIGTAIGLTLFR
jgi:hypothetical protein